MSPAAYFIAINRAELDGFHALAAALLALYRLDYPEGSQ